MRHFAHYANQTQDVQLEFFQFGFLNTSVLIAWVHIVHFTELQIEKPKTFAQVPANTAFTGLLIACATLAYF